MNIYDPTLIKQILDKLDFIDVLRYSIVGKNVIPTNYFYKNIYKICHIDYIVWKYKTNNLYPIQYIVAHEKRSDIIERYLQLYGFSEYSEQRKKYPHTNVDRSLNSYKKFTLCNAMAYGTVSSDIISVLCNYGCRDILDINILMDTISNCKTDYVKVLLDQKVINSNLYVKKSGILIKPLDMAIEQGYGAIVQLLVSYQTKYPELNQPP
jgi:hypothetical protein